MSSSAPAYPSPVSFPPVLHLVSGDPLLSPPASHTLRLIAKIWQNTKAPDIKHLSKLLYTTLTYRGTAAEQCLGHPGSTTVALLPSGTCWRRSWGGASGAQAVSSAAHTEILGAAGHLELHLHPLTQGQHHTYVTAAGEKTLVGHREKRLEEFFQGLPTVHQDSLHAHLLVRKVLLMTSRNFHYRPLNKQAIF